MARLPQPPTWREMELPAVLRAELELLVACQDYSGNKTFENRERLLRAAIAFALNCEGLPKRIEVES